MKKNHLIPLIAIVLAACLLFGLTAALEGVAAKNVESVMMTTMKAMLPDSETFVEEEYTGEDANIVAVWKGETGFVVETKTYGYADEITMLVGVCNDGTVTGLCVKDMHETYGLGFNALTDWEFLAQFLHTAGDVAIGTSGADAFSGATGDAAAETETYVDGITGATVTSKAIARSVNSAVAFVTGADTASAATSWGG